LPYETAYGTLAGSQLQAGTIRDLREKLQVDPAAPPHVFAYQTDAWIYLTLPADNPTPFALLRPVYNTPEQFQTAIDHLERDPQAVVFLGLLTVKQDDPFLAYLRKGWRETAEIGPPVFLGTSLYRLWTREPTG
jgi:hypothetical protein